MDQAWKQKDRTWTYMSRGGGGGPWSLNVQRMKLGTLAVVQVGGWWVKCLDDWGVCFQYRSVIYLIFCLSDICRVWRRKIGPELTCPGGGGGPWSLNMRGMILGTLAVVQVGGWWVKCLDDWSIWFHSRIVPYLWLFYCLSDICRVWRRKIGPEPTCPGGWWRALVIEYARDEDRYLGRRPGGWVVGQVPGRLRYLFSI